MLEWISNKYGLSIDIRLDHWGKLVGRSNNRFTNEAIG